MGGPRLLQAIEECSSWSESNPLVTSLDSALWACTGAMRKATTADQVLWIEQLLHDLILVAPTQPSDHMGWMLAPLSHQPSCVPRQPPATVGTTTAGGHQGASNALSGPSQWIPLAPVAPDMDVVRLWVDADTELPVLDVSVAIAHLRRKCIWLRLVQRVSSSKSLAACSRNHPGELPSLLPQIPQACRFQCSFNDL